MLVHELRVLHALLQAIAVEEPPQSLRAACAGRRRRRIAPNLSLIHI